MAPRRAPTAFLCSMAMKVAGGGQEKGITVEAVLYARCPCVKLIRLWPRCRQLETIE